MYHHNLLKQFCKDIFLKIGCSEDHAAIAADILVTADLRGVDSHGIARLSGYVRLWEIGRINTTPNIKVIHETSSTATVDGDKGLGLVVAPAVMKMTIDKANKNVLDQINAGKKILKDKGEDNYDQEIRKSFKPKFPEPVLKRKKSIIFKR